VNDLIDEGSNDPRQIRRVPEKRRFPAWPNTGSPSISSQILERAWSPESRSFMEEISSRHIPMDALYQKRITLRNGETDRHLF